MLHPTVACSPSLLSICPCSDGSGSGHPVAITRNNYWINIKTNNIHYICMISIMDIDELVTQGFRTLIRTINNAQNILWSNQDPYVCTSDRVQNQFKTIENEEKSQFWNKSAQKLYDENIWHVNMAKTIIFRFSIALTSFIVTTLVKFYCFTYRCVPNLVAKSVVSELAPRDSDHCWWHDISSNAILVFPWVYSLRKRKSFRTHLSFIPIAPAYSDFIALQLHFIQ